MWDWENVLLDNISTSMTNNEVIKVNSNNFSPFISNAPYTKSNNDLTIKFRKCVNNISFFNVGTCASVFVGSGPCPGEHDGKDVNLIYQDCTNNGNIYSKGQVGYLWGNQAYLKDFTDKRKLNLSIIEEDGNGITNNGIIKALTYDGNAEIASGYTKTNNKDNIKITGELALKGSGSFAKAEATTSPKLYISGSTIKIQENESSGFDLNHELSVVIGKLSFKINAGDKDSSMSGLILPIGKIEKYDSTIDNGFQELTSSDIVFKKESELQEDEKKDLKFEGSISLGFEYATKVANGKILVVFRLKSGFTYNTWSVTKGSEPLDVMSYDKDGNIESYNIISLK